MTAQIDVEKLEFVFGLNPAIQEVAFREDANGSLQALVVPDLAYLKESFGLKTSVMPNGLEVAYTSEGEVAHFFEDIFAEQNYLKDYLKLQEGDLVFDVGGNAGYFSLFVGSQLKDCAIFAFEPCPPLFEVMSFNALRHQLPVTLFNMGLSDRKNVLPFTYYPFSSGYSTFYADAEEEKSLLKNIMANQGQLSDELLQQSQEICDFKFTSQTYQCTLDTLSSVIETQHVKVIDLLKVDAEKSELDILRGMTTAHWRKVKQIVIEVHNTQDQLSAILELLKENHFEVQVVKDPLYADTVMHMVYGINGGFVEMPGLKTAASKYRLTQSSQSSPNALLSAQSIRAQLAGSLPEEMLPSEITLVQSLSGPLPAPQKACQCRGCSANCPGKKP
jgi:FkbM family methyltransferase